MLFMYSTGMNFVIYDTVLSSLPMVATVTLIINLTVSGPLYHDGVCGYQ